MSADVWPGELWQPRDISIMLPSLPMLETVIDVPLFPLHAAPSWVMHTFFPSSNSSTHLRAITARAMGSSCCRTTSTEDSVTLRSISAPM